MIYDTQVLEIKFLDILKILNLSPQTNIYQNNSRRIKSENNTFAYDEIIKLYLMQLLINSQFKNTN